MNDKHRPEAEFDDHALGYVRDMENTVPGMLAEGDYFSRYNALIAHVLPIPAHKHGVEEFKIDGQTVDATYLQGATVPLNVTGLPGLSMRFGTSKEGLPINVQVVGKWQAESTILHLASLLESISTVRNLHPSL